MEKLFFSVNHLDRRCYEDYALSEDLLMEHAALGMASCIEEYYGDKQRILIVCGSGNNGADGIALARLLTPRYEVGLYVPGGVKSQMATLQLERSQKVGVMQVPSLEHFENPDIVVDALFGSGLNRPLEGEYLTLIDKLNRMDTVKIACDIPSGILEDGSISTQVFSADMTVTMGALKWSLFSDLSKDYVGDIVVADLGVNRQVYEGESSMYVLESGDMKLPHRMRQNSHKGSYGHCVVLSGEKEGASMLSSQAAMEFGAGLVTMIIHERRVQSSQIMQSDHLPDNTTAICAGMGLGDYYDEASLQTMLLDHDIPMVIDADLFAMPVIKKLLSKRVVITPHPKEFVTLLKLMDIADISVPELQGRRMHYAELFSEHYPEVVLLLKGANVIIAHQKRFFINPFGSAKLSKGGSGDVLAGLIGALLAQGYDPLDATISASLAHTLAAQRVDKNSYAVTPEDIIQQIGIL